MTEFVRFDAAFEHKDERSGQRTRYPSGWAGEVDPAVAGAARKAKAVAPAASEEKAKPASVSDKK
ncbi:MAG: hypothetical protein DI629_12135 [Mesorhizobium amorphae]|nr:MAG: hypothetical protein DI629_12135 [Mesorhizobium amorphae]